MAFQTYRLKYIGKTSFNNQVVTKYRYNNTSIAVTVDERNNTRLISMAAHGIGNELTYEDKCGIAAHLGLDLDREIDEYKIAHPTDPMFGGTHYFRQSIDPNRPLANKVSSGSTECLNEGNPPVIGTSYIPIF